MTSEEKTDGAAAREAHEAARRPLFELPELCDELLKFVPSSEEGLRTIIAGAKTGYIRDAGFSAPEQQARLIRVCVANLSVKLSEAVGGRPDEALPAWQIQMREFYCGRRGAWGNVAGEGEPIEEGEPVGEG